jgi:beta-galactosidase
MAVTGDRLERYRDLWAAYQPAKAEVGVLFSPQTYYLCWAEEGKSDRMVNALQGYCRALVGRSIPYLVIEQDHLQHLEGLKVLFLPHTLVIDDATAARVAQWVRDGGTLVCESECGAFSSQGIYRYPEDRFLAKLTGVREIGRRSLKTPISVEVEGQALSLAATTWTTPLDDEDTLFREAAVGSGKVIFLGSYLGEGYWADKTADFETLLESIVRGAGWTPAVECLSPTPQPDQFVYLKHGASGGRNVAFVFFPPEVEVASLRFAPGFFPGGMARDVIAEQAVTLTDGPEGQTVALAAPGWRFAVLVGDLG